MKTETLKKMATEIRTEGEQVVYILGKNTERIAKKERSEQMDALCGVADKVLIHCVQNALADDKTAFVAKKYSVAVKTRKGGRIIPLGRLLHEAGVKTPAPAMTLDRARVWEKYLLGKADYKGLRDGLKAITRKEREMKEALEAATKAEETKEVNK